jgi:hypothetical protein
MLQLTGAFFRAATLTPRPPPAPPPRPPRFFATAFFPVAPAAGLSPAALVGCLSFVPFRRRAAGFLEGVVPSAGFAPAAPVLPAAFFGAAFFLDAMRSSRLMDRRWSTSASMAVAMLTPLSQCLQQTPTTVKMVRQRMRMKIDAAPERLSESLWLWDPAVFSYLDVQLLLAKGPAELPDTVHQISSCKYNGGTSCRGKSWNEGFVAGSLHPVRTLTSAVHISKQRPAPASSSAAQSMLRFPLTYCFGCKVRDLLQVILRLDCRAACTFYRGNRRLARVLCGTPCGRCTASRPKC